MDPPADDENAPVIRSLIEKYRNTVSRSEKIRILTIFADSWSLRKIMEKFGCSQRMATQANYLVLEKGILSTPIPKMGKALPVEITEMVISFYKEDDISRPMLGKKDCFTENGEKIKVQKKLVLSNLKETYRQFKDRYPETKIGFSKFSSLRPRECVLAGASGIHSVCVCTIHNNVKLMMAGSMMNKKTANEEIPLKHYSHAIAKTMCNPSLPSCHLVDCTECPGREPLEKCWEDASIKKR